MKFLFLMDPLETVNFHSDTSFIFMKAAHNAGHQVYYIKNEGISLLNSDILFDATLVIPTEGDFPFEIKEDVILNGTDIDAVFIRTDPPFDDAYIMNTWMLDLLPSNVLVLNNPSGVRSVNEKIVTTQFDELTPDTLVTQNQNMYNDFLAKHKKIILKPCNGYGGAGIFKVNITDSNRNVIFEISSKNGSEKVILQSYVKEAEIGDKRILLLNGEPLGALLRVHSEDDHRNNFYAGGHAEAVEITERDLEVIATIKPYLKEHGLYFTGIDMLGDYLIEINVTSPTCLQEMNSLYNKSLENDVIEFVENEIKRRNK